MSSDAGIYLQREALERAGSLTWMTPQPVDPRDPRRFRYPLSQLLRDSLALIG
ncbi:MAG: hypothetical protein ACLFMS_08375 [Halorhodospira sp.]